MRTKYDDLPKDIQLNLCHIQAKLTVVLACINNPKDFINPETLTKTELEEIYNNIQTMLE